MDHSDPKIVKYFWKLLTSNIISVIFGGLLTPLSLTPLDPYRGAYWGGLNEGGNLMYLTPKCDMFLESP